MTAKQEKFCLIYATTLNASEAARQAGYAHSCAGQTGSDLLKKPEIQDRIEEITANANAGLVAQKEEILRILTMAARGEMTEEAVVVINGCPTSVSKPIKPADRIRAAELLGRRYRLFEQETAGSGVTIVQDIGGEIL